MSKKRANIRRRIIISSVLIAVLLFFLTSPLSLISIQLFQPPRIDTPIEITKNVEEVLIQWEIDNKDSVLGYEFITDNEVFPEVFVGKEEESFTYLLANNNADFLTIEIREVDIIQRRSEPEIVEIDLSNPDLQFLDIRLADSEIEATVINEITISIFVIAFLVSMALVIATLWIFQFNIQNFRVFSLVLYPGFVVYSYLLFVISVINFADDIVRKFFLSFFIALLFFIVIYLLLLTINIIYNSLFYELPLEQAAKASQFIFTLTSSFLSIIFYYSSNFDIFIKAVLITLSVLFLSFGSILMVRTKKLSVSILKSIGISLVIFLSLLILSMWPVNFVLVMVAVAIILYILLSLSLEVTQNISSQIWREYVFLLFLVFVIFISTASWGVNGTMFG